MTRLADKTHAIFVLYEYAVYFLLQAPGMLPGCSSQLMPLQQPLVGSLCSGTSG